MKTGLFDKFGNEIKVGDTTRLIFEDGTFRDFTVEFKTIQRTVKTNPDFDDEYVNVYITGVVFCWNGYDLFPCVDENGVSDVSKMEIVNTYFTRLKDVLLRIKQGTPIIVSNVFIQEEIFNGIWEQHLQNTSFSNEVLNKGVLHFEVEDGIFRICIS